MIATHKTAACVLALATVVLCQSPQWKRVQYDAPIHRAESAIAFDAKRERLVLFGGRLASYPNVSFGDTWEWDGLKWIEMKSTNAPTARFGHAMVYDAARQVTLLFGGSNKNDTWTWDGKGWTQLTPTNAPFIRSDHAMVYDSDRKLVVLFGGANRNDTWEWDGKNWTQASPTTSPTGRRGAAMAYDSDRRRTLLFGGLDIRGSDLGDTWEWDGKDWAKANPTSSPRGRHEHTMIFNPVRKRTVLFGGQFDVLKTTPLDDTWEFDGKNWIKMSPLEMPSARSGQAMVYNSLRRRAALFGGPDRSDLWEWDGKVWTEIRGSSTPSPTQDHAMVYDLARQRVVLFGGQSSNETWEWDGRRWHNMRPKNSPPIRNETRMVYDAARKVTLLVRGEDREIWEWDGQDWTKKTPNTSPSKRSLFALAYDIWRGRTILFGGAFFNGSKYIPLGDTWEWDGTSWTERKPQSSPPAAFQSLDIMEYDDLHRRTVLASVNGTWIWDGVDWTRISTDARYGVMVYDSARQRIVASQDADRTHEWNGRTKTWSTITNNESLTTRGYAMAYDAARQRTIRFGGCITVGTRCEVTIASWDYCNAQPMLTADVDSITIATGGAQKMTIDAGPDLKNSAYWLFGSVSGTMPGVVLTGIHIPLNPDVYTNFTVTFANSTVLPGSRGTLSATGTSTASFVVPANLGVLTGYRFHHAFVAFDGTTGKVFASSNPVSVEMK